MPAKGLPRCAAISPRTKWVEVAMKKLCKISPREASNEKEGERKRK